MPSLINKKQNNSPGALKTIDQTEVFYGSTSTSRKPQFGRHRPLQKLSGQRRPVDKLSFLFVDGRRLRADFFITPIFYHLKKKSKRGSD